MFSLTVVLVIVTVCYYLLICLSTMSLFYTLKGLAKFGKEVFCPKDQFYGGWDLCEAAWDKDKKHLRNKSTHTHRHTLDMQIAKVFGNPWATSGQHCAEPPNLPRPPRETERQRDRHMAFGSVGTFSSDSREWRESADIRPQTVWPYAGVLTETEKGLGSAKVRSWACG